MVLRVPFEEFVATVLRLMSQPEAFIESVASGTKLTAAVPLGGVLVQCVTTLPEKEVRKRLEQSDIPCLPGSWSQSLSDEGCTDAPIDIYVAAIAYTSRDARPGLWVDAFPYEPTALHALRMMYEEFRANGEIGEVTFEDFVKHSNSNVVVSNRAQLEGWARSKSDPEAVASADVGNEPDAPKT